MLFHNKHSRKITYHHEKLADSHNIEFHKKNYFLPNEVTEEYM
jgi:hypothetical protein